ncbi:putative reverse transcriptase [Monocercomonoides exilis]|uniref:putative reverse transcriptase n=1 Tax=Monocercomonoides exilis TaxID=2049356 RepID=UPI00355A60F0|nr:putative reverse transcriptase [Monocercomonoides exilis]
MPFGYKDAPRTFTKVMRKVLKYMREEWSVRAIAYLDDIVLLHQDPQELNIIVEKTLSMFNKLGLLLNSEKCHLIPSQQFKFLGFQWDTNQFVVQIEESKKTELMKECKKWRRIAQNNRVVSIKKFASLIGKLNATRFVYQEASLNLSQLYKLLNKALSLNGWQGKMRVNASITNCLMKWSERLKENQSRRLNPVFRPEAILTTDASGFAIGATLKVNNQMLDFYKLLPPPVRNQSSNYRELFAINQAIAHFSNSIQNQEIRNLLIRSDNTTAVYNLNRWGAGPNLRILLKKIWNQTQALKVVVKAQHIPGERNVRADGLSRLAKGGDYEVEQEALEEITNQLQMHITLDAFATKENTKSTRWCGPGSNLSQDGLQISWRNETVLAHPPVPLIPAVIRKAAMEKARVLLLLPDWKGQIWEPLLNNTNHISWTWRRTEEIIREGRWMKQMNATLPPGRLRICLINP